MYKKENIYIAGPECFYTGGPELLRVMKARTENMGMGVTLPNDNPLDMGNPDHRKRADSIFKDLETIMHDTTGIIADLEAYRGSEPDSGTVYEIGMAYAEGYKCFGYTRDKRNLYWKDQKYRLVDGEILDEHGEVAPYADLPFAPTIIGSTTIIEGDYDDCLKAYMLAVEEDHKNAGRRYRYESQMDKPTLPPSDKVRIYLAGPERYAKDGAEKLAVMKALCEKYGFEVYSPLDWAEGVTEIETDSPYTRAVNLFDNFQQHVRNADVIIANLNDYRGYECMNDASFECGMGFQLGKKLYAYMDDTRPMIERIPNYGEAKGYKDMTGSDVENFNYPLNLMFSCSMKIFEGAFENVIEAIAEDIKKERI